MMFIVASRAPLAALRARFVPAHRRPVRDRLPPSSALVHSRRRRVPFPRRRLPRLFFRLSSPRNIQRSSSDGVSFAAIRLLRSSAVLDAFAASTARLSCDALCNAATRSSGLRASTTSFSRAREVSRERGGVSSDGIGRAAFGFARGFSAASAAAAARARRTSAAAGSPRANLTLGAELDGGVREAVSDRLAADADADVARLDEDVGTQGRLRRGARLRARRGRLQVTRAVL